MFTSAHCYWFASVPAAYLSTSVSAVFLSACLPACLPQNLLLSCLSQSCCLSICLISFCLFASVSVACLSTLSPGAYTSASDFSSFPPADHSARLSHFFFFLGIRPSLSQFLLPFVLPKFLLPNYPFVSISTAYLPCLFLPWLPEIPPSTFICVAYAIIQPSYFQQSAYLPLTTTYHHLSLSLSLSLSIYLSIYLSHFFFLPHIQNIRPCLYISFDISVAYL